MLGDRMWDDDGREWTTSKGAWLTEDAVTAALTAGAPAVVHGVGVSWRVLPNTSALDHWVGARAWFETPGEASSPGTSSDGRTCAAQLWRSAGDILVGFVEMC